MLLLGSQLRFRLGEDQQELMAVRLNLGFLGIGEVTIADRGRSAAGRGLVQGVPRPAGHGGQAPLQAHAQVCRLPAGAVDSEQSGPVRRQRSLVLGAR